MTIQGALVYINEQLKEVENHSISDARLLLFDVCKLSLTSYVQRKNEELNKHQIFSLDDYIMQRKNGTPIQYIIGRASFYGLDFLTNENVLIPRYDTEILVQEAIKYIANRDLNVLDLCTGSGIVGICIAKYTMANVTCTDISENACKLCEKNSNLHNARVNILQKDMLSGLGKFDLIVCNPPYISTGDMLLLDTEVKNFEPTLALDGGKMGLDFYEYLGENAHLHLNTNGALYLEIGYNQKQEVVKILSDKYEVSAVDDLAGRNRVLCAYLK